MSSDQNIFLFVHYSIALLAHHYVNFQDKFHYIMTYMNDLQNETQSMVSDSSDSGLPTSGVPSEIELEGAGQCH